MKLALILLWAAASWSGVCENQVRKTFNICTKPLKPWTTSTYTNDVQACLNTYNQQLVGCDRDAELLGQWRDYTDSSKNAFLCENIDAEEGTNEPAKINDSRDFYWVINAGKISRRYRYYLGSLNCKGKVDIVDTVGGAYTQDLTSIPKRFQLTFTKAQRQVKSDEAALALNNANICDKTDWVKGKYNLYDDVACIGDRFLSDYPPIPKNTVASGIYEVTPVSGGLDIAWNLAVGTTYPTSFDSNTEYFFKKIKSPTTLPAQFLGQWTRKNLGAGRELCEDNYDADSDGTREPNESQGAYIDVVAKGFSYSWRKFIDSGICSGSAFIDDGFTTSNFKLISLNANEAIFSAELGEHYRLVSNSPAIALALNTFNSGAGSCNKNDWVAGQMYSAANFDLSNCPNAEGIEGHTMIGAPVGMPFYLRFTVNSSTSLTVEESSDLGNTWSLWMDAVK